MHPDLYIKDSPMVQERGSASVSDTGVRYGNAPSSIFSPCWLEHTAEAMVHVWSCLEDCVESGIIDPRA